MKCLICDIYDANQTGAHIFPAWMIASAFDQESRTRDHEIIYAMTPLDLKLPFFGNSVQPDLIKKQIGRNLTDEEIQSQENLVTVNNLWCKSCERRFKQIEDYFLDNVDRKITDFSNSNNLDIITLNNSNNYLIRLFLYSIILRASLAKFMGFKLTDKTSKKLKFFLNNYLKEKLKSTIHTIENSFRKDQICKYPIRCIITEQNPKDPSGFIYVDNKHNKPYCFIINRYIIQFYGRGNRAHFKPESFFGVSSIVSNTPNFKNYKEEAFRIGLINLKLWNDVKVSFIEEVNNKRLEKYALIFKSKFGFNPEKSLIRLFQKELIDNDIPIGIKYTKEKIVEAMNRTIS